MEIRKYIGGVMPKSQLAEHYKFSLITLKRYLKDYEHNLPYFFSAKKTVPPIEVNLIRTYLGEFD